MEGFIVGYPNSTISFAIPTASADGKYYSRYPSGQPGGGDTDTSAILLFEDFSGGTVGANVNQVDRFGSCTYSNTVVETGKTTSMACTASAGSTAFGYSFDLNVHGTYGDTLWFCVRMFRPTGYSDTANPWLKFFRMRTYPAGGGDLGYDDVYLYNDGTFHFIYEGVNSWQSITTTDADKPVTGVWETYDYMVVFDGTAAADGGNARVRFWKNRVLLGEVTDRVTLIGTGSYVSECHHSTYWNGGAPKNEILYVSEAAVAAKIAGVRDDTPYLATDANGLPLIALGT